MKKPKLLIFDADCLLFFTAWGFKDSMTKISLLACQNQLDKLIEGILNKHKADFFIGFYGHAEGKNFRYRVATIKPYKASREYEPWQKFYIPKLKEYYEKKWKFIALKQIEADDAVVIAHEQYKEAYEILHISEDKDFKSQVPATRYNPKKGKQIVETWGETEVIKHFAYQMLVGDNSDNIAGVKGVGENSDYVKHLNNMHNPTEEEIFEFLKHVYEKIYKEKALDYMVENAVLLRMLKTPRFDYPKNIELQKWNHKTDDLQELLKI